MTPRARKLRIRSRHVDWATPTASASSLLVRRASFCRRVRSARSTSSKCGTYEEYRMIFDLLADCLKNLQSLRYDGARKTVSPRAAPGRSLGPRRGALSPL